MKKSFILLPVLAFSAVTFSSCASRPEPVQLTLISEWGSFSDEYPTTKLTLNTMKSQKLSEVKGFSEAIPEPFFSDVMEFKGWAFDPQGTKFVPNDYVINENTTFYANYERNTVMGDTSYIVYNYNTSDVGGEGRNVVKFLCKDITANLTKNDIKIPGFELDTDYTVDVVAPTAGEEYTKVTITYIDEVAKTRCGNSIIKIEHKINDLRLSSGYTDSPYTVGNEYITAILLADGVTTISDCAFDSCYWLMAASLPSSITSIGYGAFNMCYSLNSIELPEDLETIGEAAFSGCATMEHVYFNDGLETIGKNAFLACASLREIHIPDTVNKLGEGAFHYCLQNNDLKIGRRVAEIPAYCFGENYYLQKVTIPNTVNKLGTACFQYCDSLTELNFEDGGDPITEAKDIDAAFQYCISISKVKIPSRFKTLGKSTFQHSLLYELDLTDSSEMVSYGQSPFGNDTPLVYNYGKIIVPSKLVNTYKNDPNWKPYKDIIVGK